MWLLWSAESRFTPSQQSGKRTWSTSVPAAAVGRVGDRRLIPWHIQADGVDGQRAGGGGVAGDHPQPGRERLDCDAVAVGAAAVVDEGRHRGHGDAVLEQHRHPVGRAVGRRRCRSCAWPTSDWAVDAAFVVWLPKNWCRWDMPGMFGWTIGSSGATWLEPQRTRKVVTPPPPELPASAGPPGPLEALPPLAARRRPGCHRRAASGRAWRRPSTVGHGPRPR